jgi:hypothetical protein
MVRNRLRFAAVLAGLALFGVLIGAPTRPARAQVSEHVPLAAGCNSVVLTWPSGVLMHDVVAAITPADAVKAIWLRVPGTDTYLSYAPDAPQLIGGLRTAGYLETVQICMRTPGVLTRPLS